MRKVQKRERSSSTNISGYDIRLVVTYNSYPNTGISNQNANATGKLFQFLGLDDLGSEKSPCSSIGGNLPSQRPTSTTGSEKGEAGGVGGSSSIITTPGGHQQRRSRAGRVRTVLTEKQLTLLKNCYNLNPRPDALMKEQLTEMTGLSSRVIRVWFQNKRCKDKKKMCLQKSKVTSFSSFLEGNDWCDKSWHD